MRRIILVLVGLTSAAIAAGCSAEPAAKDAPPGAGSPPSGAGSPSPTSYTVGGTVTGLMRAGLRLAVNGAEDLPISQDGPFVFPSSVARGAAYAITATQQPPGETCSVVNGAGTMASGDVSNVDVTCSPLSYTIGGTISGLQGTVVLENNGGDTLSISADGSFAFPTPVASGATYAVGVAAQPWGPNQTCVVSNGSDAVVSSDVGSISVQCTTNVYAVNVQVSGLQSSGLVLQDNGGDDLWIQADGKYSFATRIVDGEAYAVSVLVQPSDPAQTCTTDAPAGGLVNGGNANVLVTCE